MSNPIPALVENPIKSPTTIKQIPSIRTERLLLRSWRESDLDPLASMMANPQVARFIGGVQPRSSVWRSMAMFVGLWALHGYGFWAVERNSDRVFLGRVGLWHPEGWPGIELAWSLDRPYWGNGYAIEAAKAALDYGFLNLPVSKLVSLIDRENGPSQRVASRLGETRRAPITVELYGQSFSLDVWEIGRDRRTA
jgi:RimJ/RimL family protein N-acetyltransferase